jgi:hypothetical protein
LKCKVILAAVNEDDNTVFFKNDSKWNLDKKSLKENKVSENNWK